MPPVPNPAGVPWDPRAQLPPGYQSGVNGVTIAWDNLVSVIQYVLPAAWNEALAAGRG